MNDIEWSHWIQGDGSEAESLGAEEIEINIDEPSVGIDDAAHYRIPMSDYKRITGMPEWMQAPEWAQWLAQDWNGSWWFYGSQVQAGIGSWSRLDQVIGELKLGGSGTVLGDWRDTLQERPSDPLDTHPDSELDADQYSVGADAMTEHDTVNAPSHYTSGDIECIDAIKAQMTADQYAGYLRGNVVKYLWRYEQKGGEESLRKARWYLDRLIEAVENE